MHTLSVERRYSKKQIKLAGRLLGGVVQRTPEVEEAFRIAHNWRLHHAYPMVRERAKLTRLVKPKGGLTAGRLKRISSIRKKLFRGDADLPDMQDLVGCRAIVNNMDDLQEVLSSYKPLAEGGRVRRKTDYIAFPKSSGYRSVHLVVRFAEQGAGQKHVGCNVEIQLRTHLQHVWGTTVEAVGAMRNEDLKAGEGNQQWLRFMTLMSGHIAELEGQPRGEHLPISYKELKDEARELSQFLNVRQNLSAYNDLMHQADVYKGSTGSRYMLKMDAVTGNIDVRPAWREMFDFDDLDDDFEETKQSIEVSVDSMTALKQAYPNYFLDTRKFLEILSEIDSTIQSKKSNYIDRLDLSFLPKVLPEPKEKTLYLEHTGIVYWGAKQVGTWERSVYDEYYFWPIHENYIAFTSKNVGALKADIQEWLKDY